jgi:hypothetical protein
MRNIFVALSLLFLVACSASDAVEKGLKPQERNVIRGAIDDVARGDTGALSQKMPAELAAKLRNVEPVMRNAMPTPPLKVTILNARWSITGQDRRANAIYQIEGRSGWALVEADTLTSAGKTMLTSFYVRRTPSRPSGLNSLSLQVIGVGHIVILGAMLAAVGVTIVALLRIWRSGSFNRRWLWTIGALLGITRLQMNWTTGEFLFLPFQVQIFSAGAIKSPIFAPWILSVSVPIVAIIVLLRHRKSSEIGSDGAEGAPSET